MRELTGEEIEELSQRHGVKEKAVENFLRSMNLLLQLLPETAHRVNLMRDATLYQWNQATCDAINDGIKVAYKEES